MASILIVEDDPDHAIVSCRIVQKLGHATLTAADGAAALEAARSWNPDLILLDVTLAGALTGLDVARALGADAALAEIPVLMLSGWAFAADIEAGYAAGASGYLAKPYNAADLQAQVTELLTGGARRQARPTV